jgi:hypothetical protein
MTQVVVTGLMFLLTLVQLISARRRRSQRVLFASALITLAMLLNVDQVYLWVDSLIGSGNITTFVSDAALITGTYFLSAATIASVRGAEERAVAWPTVLLATVAVVMLISFALIDMHHSSSSFMVDFGDQMAAAAYNSAQFVYLGVVLAYTGVVILRCRPRMTSRANVVGFTIVATGCLATLLLVLDVLGMNAANLLDWNSELTVLQALYSPLFVAVMALLCIGLAIPPTSRHIATITRKYRSHTLVTAIEPIWHRFVPAPPLPNSFGAHDTEMRLHRLLIEIEDERLKNPQVLPLTNAEARVIHNAHRLLTSRSDLEMVTNQ